MTERDPQDTAVTDLIRAADTLSAAVIDLARVVSDLLPGQQKERVAVVQQRAEDVQAIVREITPKPGQPGKRPAPFTPGKPVGGRP